MEYDARELRIKTINESGRQWEGTSSQKAGPLNEHWRVQNTSILLEVQIKLTKVLSEENWSGNRFFHGIAGNEFWGHTHRTVWAIMARFNRAKTKERLRWFLIHDQVAQLWLAAEEVQPPGPQAHTCTYQAQEGQDPEMYNFCILFPHLHDCCQVPMVPKPQSACCASAPLAAKYRESTRASG